MTLRWDGLGWAGMGWDERCGAVVAEACTHVSVSVQRSAFTFVYVIVRYIDVAVMVGQRKVYASRTPAALPLDVSKHHVRVQGVFAYQRHALRHVAEHIYQNFSNFVVTHSPLIFARGNNRKRPHLYVLAHVLQTWASQHIIMGTHGHTAGTCSLGDNG